MNCPVCSQVMEEEDFGGVKVDVCKKGCKSLWFDWVELRRLDEKSEGAGQSLEDALNSDHHKQENRDRLPCPKCGLPMVAHFYQYSKKVTVDECYACGGFFLDSGELEVIRDNFMSKKDQQEYTEALLKLSPAYTDAIAKQKEAQKKINPGTVKRAEAVARFSGMLSHRFGR